MSNEPGADTPRFSNAPVVETRFGVQFRPLNGFRSGHFGLLWSECLGRDQWRIGSDAPLQPHLSERFDSPFLNAPVELPPVDANPSRMVLVREGNHRLFHFQPDQLTMTFKRHASDCPTYMEVRSEFGNVMTSISEFAERSALGPFAPDLWEITYVNVIPQVPLWQTPDDWAGIFPTLFPSSSLNPGGCKWSSFEGEWHLIIPGELGRVHIRVSKSVANRSQHVVLLMILTVRGQIGGEGVASWSEGIDLGHNTAIRVFYDLASDDAKSYWGGPK